MNFLTKNFVFVIAFLISNLIFAQKKTLENIVSTTSRYSGVITQNNEVKGYYMLYEVGKTKTKKSSYEIKFLDANLEEVGTNTLNMDKSVFLDAGFDGEMIAIKTYNKKTKKLEILRFDQQSKLVDTKSLEPSFMEKKEYFIYEDDRRFASIEGKGFVNYGTVDASQTSDYKLSFIPQNKTDKAWTFDEPSKKTFDKCAYLTSKDNNLYSMVGKRNSILSKDIDYYLLVNDLTTGAKKIEKKLDDEKAAVEVLNGYFDEEGNLILVGLYYEPDAKIQKAKSLGFFTYILDQNFNIKSKNYVSWEKDVAKFLPVNKRGKVKGMGYIFFHEFIKTKDGKVFGIGEQYSLPSGISFSLGGGGNTNTTDFEIDDLMVFEFTKDFKLKDIAIYPKNSSTYQITRGYSATTSARVANMYGWFDYSFIQNYQDNSKFTVAYYGSEKSKEKKKKNDNFIGFITYADGKLNPDKMILNNNDSYTRVFPAKSGFIFVYQYSGKTKTLEFRLEKVNY